MLVWNRSFISFCSANTLKILMSSLRSRESTDVGIPARRAAELEWPGVAPCSGVEVTVAIGIEISASGHRVDAGVAIGPFLAVEQQPPEIVVHHDIERTAALVAEDARDVPTTEHGFRPGRRPSRRAGDLPREPDKEHVRHVVGAVSRLEWIAGILNLPVAAVIALTRSRHRCSSAASRYRPRAPADLVRSVARAPLPSRGTGSCRSVRRATRSAWYCGYFLQRLRDATSETWIRRRDAGRLRRGELMSDCSTFAPSASTLGSFELASTPLVRKWWLRREPRFPMYETSSIMLSVSCRWYVSDQFWKRGSVKPSGATASTFVPLAKAGLMNGGRTTLAAGKPSSR